VVTFLLEHGHSKILSSPSHVRWALETCGTGFTLPIEEEDSILKVIALYRTWILEPKNRPTSINENVQYFTTVSTQLHSTMHLNCTQPKKITKYILVEGALKK
jgi:hypothetical protein